MYGMLLPLDARHSAHSSPARPGEGDPWLGRAVLGLRALVERLLGRIAG